MVTHSQTVGELFFFLEGTNLMVELSSRCSLLERAVLLYLVLTLYSKSWKDSQMGKERWKLLMNLERLSVSFFPWQAEWPKLWWNTISFKKLLIGFLFNFNRIIYSPLFSLWCNNHIGYSIFDLIEILNFLLIVTLCII